MKNVLAILLISLTVNAQAASPGTHKHVKRKIHAVHRKPSLKKHPSVSREAAWKAEMEKDAWRDTNYEGPGVGFRNKSGSNRGQGAYNYSPPEPSSCSDVEIHGFSQTQSGLFVTYVYSGKIINISNRPINRVELWCHLSGFLGTKIGEDITVPEHASELTGVFKDVLADIYSNFKPGESRDIQAVIQSTQDNLNVPSGFMAAGSAMGSELFALCN